jgi:uncharacterized protein YaaN involved in tellurite resistance
MSELDLDSTTDATASESTPSSAQESAGNQLVLSPPEPVKAVESKEAEGAIPVPAERKKELQAKADAFAKELSSMDTRAPAFAEKIDTMTSLGNDDMRASANMSNRMLERPAANVKANRGKGNTNGGDAQTRVAGTLSELRNTVTELDPNRADLSGKKKLLKWLPGGNKIEEYFSRYESAQSQLNAIIKSLNSGQDELRKDNAAIETEKQNMWKTMGKLSEYSVLAGDLDEAIDSRVSELENQGSSDDAGRLRSDALFAIRQRRQDIMTQMAVSVQGYMALDLVRKNNLELIKGVDRAETTTVAALRTAVIVAQALSRQRLVLDQISALNTTTSNLIEATSQQLQVQGAQIHQQAAQSTVDVDKLQNAFNNVFQAMDEIDRFRGQAADNMSQTVQALQGQIERAKPYLDRTRQTDESTQQGSASS